MNPFHYSAGRCSRFPSPTARLTGCFGYRIDKLTYIPDMKALSDSELLKCIGSEVLVLNCLRDEREHISHLILPQSIALARRIRPKRCYFIHMCHDIHYETDKELGAGWFPRRLEIEYFI